MLSEVQPREGAVSPRQLNAVPIQTIRSADVTLMPCRSTTNSVQDLSCVLLLQLALLSPASCSKSMPNFRVMISWLPSRGI